MSGGSNFNKSGVKKTLYDPTKMLKTPQKNKKTQIKTEYDLASSGMQRTKARKIVRWRNSIFVNFICNTDERDAT